MDPPDSNERWSARNSNPQQHYTNQMMPAYSNMAPRPHAEYRTFQGPRAMNAAPNAPVRSSRMPRKPKASVPAMGGNGATTSGPARRLWAEVDNNASAAIVPAIPAGAPVVPGAVAAAPAAVATAAPTKLSFKPISRAVDRASEDTVAGPNNELIHHDPMAIDSAEENVDEPAYTIGLRIEALKALKGPALENALRVFQCDKLYAQLENDLEKLAVEEKKARNFFGKYDGPAPIFKRDLDEGIKQLLLNRLTAIGACTGRSAKELMEKHGVTQRIADLLYLSERMLAISCSMANPAYTNGPCFGMRHIDAFVPLPKIEDQKVACTIVPDRYIGILGEEDGYTYTGLNDGRQRSLRDLGFESLIDFDLAKSNLEAPMKLTSKDMKVLLQINAALEKELPPRIKEYIVTYREQLERSLNASSKEKGVAGDLTQGAGPSAQNNHAIDVARMQSDPRTDDGKNKATVGPGAMSAVARGKRRSEPESDNFENVPEATGDLTYPDSHDILPREQCHAFAAFHPKQFSKLRKLVRLHPYRSLFDITYTDIDPIWVGTLPSFAQGWGGPILVQGQAGDTTKHSNYNRDLSKIMLTQMPAISGSPPMQRWVPRIPVAPEVAVGELAAQDHGSAFLQPDEEYDVHSLQARLDDARDANMIFGIPIPDQLLEFEKQQAALGNASATAAEGGPFFNPALVEYYQQYDAVGRHANDALGAQESSLDQAMPDAVAPANYGAFAYRAGDEDMDLGEYVGDHDYIIDRYVDEEIGVTEEDILRGYGYVSANESENWIPRSAHI